MVANARRWPAISFRSPLTAVDTPVGLTGSRFWVPWLACGPSCGPVVLVIVAAIFFCLLAVESSDKQNERLNHPMGERQSLLIGFDFDHFS